MSRTSLAQRRLATPEEVPFPVTPMLDMAFQLLAFFILTFQAPTNETRLDLYLPSAPVALAGAPEGQSTTTSQPPSDLDLETDLVVRARSDDLGELQSLSLGEADVPDIKALGDRLRRYAGLVEGKSIRVMLQADDRLRYEVAARLIGACAAAGVGTIRLGNPSGSSIRPGGANP